MKYVRKQEVQAFTFDQFVQYGLGWYAAKEQPLNNGMPWSFVFHGLSVTHENDQCYILCGPNLLKPQTLFKPDQMLVLWPDGTWSTQEQNEFKKFFEPA